MLTGAASKMHDIKFKVSTADFNRLQAKAEQAGFTGRGAIPAYLRYKEDLAPVSPGAKIGNQNRKGKVKNGK